MSNKVYFSASFFGHDYDEQAGREIKINKAFTCNEKNFIIPSIYIFDEGVVVDICYDVDIEEIKDYIRNIDNIFDLFSENNEEDDPFEQDFCFDLNINGSQLISSDEYSSESYNPIDNGIDDDSEFDFMTHYNLDKSKAWNVVRSAFEWNGKVDSDIRTVVINIVFDETPVPVVEFTSNDVGKSFEFENPKTKQSHALKIVDSAFAVFTEKDRKEYGFNMKFGHQLWYEITPPLTYDDYSITQIFKNKPYFSENSVCYFNINNGKTYNENTKTCFAFKECMNEEAKWNLSIFCEKYENYRAEINL